MMPIRPPLNVPKDLRQWTRYFEEAHVIANANASGSILDADIPSTIARDTEVAASSAAAVVSANATSAAALAAHVAAADPHTGYQLESEKNSASGYAGLNSSSRLTKGTDTTDDVIIDLATKGLVLKDTAGTPHYWRVTISTLGVLTTTDLGTTKP